MDFGRDIVVVWDNSTRESAIGWASSCFFALFSPGNFPFVRFQPDTLLYKIYYYSIHTFISTTNLLRDPGNAFP